MKRVSFPTFIVSFLPGRIVQLSSLSRNASTDSLNRRLRQDLLPFSFRLNILLSTFNYRKAMLEHLYFFINLLASSSDLFIGRKLYLTFGVPCLYTTYGACMQVYYEEYDAFCVLGVIYQNTEEFRY